MTLRQLFPAMAMLTLWGCSEPSSEEHDKCGPLDAVAGSVLIGTQADLDQLEGCRHIGDDLSIYSNDIDDLEPLAAIETIGGHLSIIGDEIVSLEPLSALETIGGDLTIGEFGPDVGYYTHVGDGGTALSDLRGLHNVRSIGGSIRMVGNPELISIADLTLPAQVDGDVSIWGNPQIASLEGFEGLERVDGSLGIYRTVVSDLDELASLSLVGDTLTIIDNPELRSFDGLQNLVGVSNLDLYSSPGLEDLSGLSGLVEVNSLTLRGCSALASLEGLDSLEHLEILAVRDNSSLTTLAGLETLDFDELYVLDNRNLVSLVGLGTADPSWIHIAGNSDLVDLAGLEVLASWAEPNLLIDGNDSLASLDGLAPFNGLGYVGLLDNPSLTDLGALSELHRTEQLVIAYNSHLVQLDGLEGLLKSGSLSIDHNAGLADITALYGLEDAGAELSIQANPMLPSCQADVIALNLAEHGWGGEVFIGCNDDLGTCD